MASFQTTCEVEIEVTDVNDNPPQFEYLSYTGMVLEHSAAGAVIPVVSIKILYLTWGKNTFERLEISDHMTDTLLNCENLRIMLDIYNTRRTNCLRRLSCAVTGSTI